MSFRLSHLFAASILSCSVAFIAEAAAPPSKPADMEDTAAWSEYFDAWEASSPGDAQLWIDKFNYWINRAPREVVMLSPDNAPAQDHLVLQDENGNDAGSIYSKLVFDEDMLKRAIDAIDRGIELYPDRLDMRLGRAAAFKFAERYDDMAESLCNTIDRCSENGGRWTLDDSSAIHEIDMQSLLEDCIQDYVHDMYEIVSAQPDSTAERAFVRLLNKEEKACPLSVMVQNNLGIWQYHIGELDRAIEHFEKAHRIVPDDSYVIFNIAILYGDKGCKDQAIEWLEKLLPNDDPQIAADAQQMIDEFKEQ